MTTCRQIFDDAKNLLVTGKVSESIKAFTNAISCGERSDLAYLSRGVAYLKDHQGKKAIDDFTEVVKMN
ncbi:MAG: tetratricopeptide repeat protein, partial [Nitrospirae bacterium]|nr:tetratricopeptide repeat protein [Nitrospirota bacterium]